MIGAIMTDRVAELRKLGLGDMFHSRSPNGASLTCLVTAVDDDTISARRITTQDDHQFNRRTGLSLGDDHSRIDCVAPLPPDVYGTLLAMDRRGQEIAALFSNGIRVPNERYRPTLEERRALDLVDEHVAANSI